MVDYFRELLTTTPIQIPPAPPEQKHRKSKDFRCFSAFMAHLTGINVKNQGI